MSIKYTTKLITQEDLYCLYECLEWNSFLKLNKEQLAKAMEQSWHVMNKVILYEDCGKHETVFYIIYMI